MLYKLKKDIEAIYFDATRETIIKIMEKTNQIPEITRGYEAVSITLDNKEIFTGTWIIFIDDKVITMDSKSFNALFKKK